ncbi:hypothetical protein BH20GEM3_BH20GEM3_13490 [soil metagenome]
MSNISRPRPRQYRELSISRMLLLLARGITLRCPHCGQGFLLRTWFQLKPKCDNCGMRTDRGEEDFFLGGMMWNIVFAEGLLVASALLVGIATWPDVPWTLLKWGSIALMVIAPFLFYPFSLCFWLACDIWIRPVTPQEMDWHRASKEGEFRKHRDR